MLDSYECPQVRFEQSVAPALGDSEKKLICGKSEFEEWNTIPLYQIRYHLKAMLQSRGYFFPEFEARTDQNILIVRPGNPLLIKDISASEHQDEIKLEKKWNLYLKPWSKDHLEELTTYVKHQLGKQGYPCPKVKLVLFPRREEIHVEVHSGEKAQFPEIQEDSTELLDANLFQRYYPFQPKDRFNLEKLELAKKRIAEASIVAASDFSVTCGEKTTILHKLSPGKPRVFGVGFGVNSESGLLGRVSWKHSRVDRYASSVFTAIRASFRQQYFISALEWYFWPKKQNFFLRPEISLSRTFEPHQIFETGELRLHPYLKYDYLGSQFTFFGGPTLSGIRQVRGDGPKRTNVFTTDLNVQVQSHDFELYRSEPRSGYLFELESRISEQGIVSDVSFQELRLDGEILWNLGDFLPPKYVLGLRSSLRATFLNETKQNLYRLPVPFRHYLGGSRTLRGFSRNELPRNDFGSLTTAYLGFEFRTALTFYDKLQPFLFLDLGGLSDQKATLDLPIYSSPGLGLRWKSPIGAVRGTASHGFAILGNLPQKDLSHWQFFVALGEEF